MELSVNDYVRTKSNGIQKIDEEGRINLGLIRPPFYIIKEEELLKSSPNIIDLIEVGDYVNGLKIDDITEKDKDHPERIAWHLTCYGDGDIPFRNDEIKSIVTKECFESMEYKI